MPRGHAAARCPHRVPTLAKSNEWGFRRSIGLIDEVNHEAIEIACWGSPNRDDQPRRVELTAYSLTTGSQKYTVSPS